MTPKDLGKFANERPCYFKQEFQSFNAADMRNRYEEHNVLENGLSQELFIYTLFAKGSSFKQSVDYSCESIRGRTQEAFRKNDACEMMTCLMAQKNGVSSGIGCAVASAILAWAKPSCFAVIDRRAVQSLTNLRTEILETFVNFRQENSPDAFYRKVIKKAWYPTYLDFLRAAGKSIRKSPQQMDVWLYNFAKLGGENTSCFDDWTNRK